MWVYILFACMHMCVCMCVLYFCSYSNHGAVFLVYFNSFWAEETALSLDLLKCTGCGESPWWSGLLWLLSVVGVGRGIASLELLALSRFLRVCSSNPSTLITSLSLELLALSRFLRVCSSNPSTLIISLSLELLALSRFLWVCSSNPSRLITSLSLELLALSRFLWVCSPINIDHFANPGASAPVQMDLPERAWAATQFVTPACVPLIQSLGRTFRKRQATHVTSFLSKISGI